MHEPMLQDIADVERADEAVLIMVRGRLDLFNAPSLMAAFDQFLLEGVSQFVIDLSAVRAVDGDGDYPLLHLLKSVQGVDGSVTLICPPGNPVRIFYEMLHLDTLFHIVDSRDEVRQPLAMMGD